MAEEKQRKKIRLNKQKLEDYFYSDDMAKNMLILAIIVLFFVVIIILGEIDLKKFVAPRPDEKREICYAEDLNEALALNQCEFYRWWFFAKHPEMIDKVYINCSCPYTK